MMSRRARGSSLLALLLFPVAGCESRNLLGVLAADDYTQGTYTQMGHLPDQAALAVAGSEGISTFEETTGLRTARLVTAPVGDLSWSGGKLAALRTTVNRFADVLLFDQLSMPPDSRVVPNQVQSFAVGLSPDASVLAIGEDLGHVARMLLSDGSELTPTLGPDARDPVHSVQISPDGVYIAGASSDMVRIWRSSDAALVTHLSGTNVPIAFCA